MKISLNWLKQYITTTLSTNEISEALTFCGLEVESVHNFESLKGGLKGLVVGEVISKEKHPDADKLSVTTVHVGTDTLLNIVCGAPNVEAGQKVIVATIGTQLFPVSGEPFEIKKSKIRGVVSEGMICAEDEIGLGESHAGIMVLPADTKVGMPAADYFKIESDEVFEIGLTPNRIDAASHIGVARDLAAVIAIKTGTPTPLHLPSCKLTSSSTNTMSVQVDIVNQEDCVRYSGICLNHIAVKDSPDWLKHKLLAIGLKPINNVVDVTNFVLHETGQPLHAFDAAKITGNTIVVKKYSEPQKFVTLDGVERSLTADDLMICNSTEPMCIAGVYGGLQSGVSSQTTSIFLESACFSAASVRKTAKHHNLKTDASFRFERGTDAGATVLALVRAANLLCEIAGAQVASEIIDVYPIPVKPVEVKLNLKRCGTLIGKQIPVSQIKLILEHLDIVVLAENEEEMHLQIPLAKVDVTREADVVEEILRIYGYNNIELPSQMKMALLPKPKPDVEQIHRKLCHTLSGMGLHEILNNSLSSSRYATKYLNADEKTIVKPLNALSSELDSMRQSLVFGMLETISYNTNRKNADLKLFELGKTYKIGNDGQPIETNVLAIALTGRKYSENWNSTAQKDDFYDLKGILNAVFAQLGIKPSETQQNTAVIATQGVSYVLNTKTIAQAGIINKGVAKGFDIENEILYAELFLDEVYKPIHKVKIQFAEVPKFPEVRRDLALLINEQVAFEKIEKIAYQTEKSLLKEVRLFDVYQGKNLEAGKKSYAVSFMLQDTQATLNDKQIEKVMAKLIKAYEEQLGASLRA